MPEMICRKKRNLLFLLFLGMLIFCAMPARAQEGEHAWQSGHVRVADDLGTGEDPEQPARRSEAGVLLNRAWMINERPKEAVTRGDLVRALAELIPQATQMNVYQDVPLSSPYFAGASIAAEYGWMYGMEDGLFHPELPLSRKEAAAAINRAMGYSGDAELDQYVENVLDAIITEGMSDQEKLRAAFNWTRDSFTYLRRNYYKTGDKGWTLSEGKIMFETGQGNCYCYAAVYYYLTRRMGFQSRAISGMGGKHPSPHGWVEIDLDGVTYVFDTQLEMAYRKKGWDYDLFCKTYEQMPFSYIKQEGLTAA